MTQATVTTRAPLSTVTAVDTAIDTVSGVSWAAVFAGAFVAAAFSLALVALGAGIGLVSVSPWSSNNPSVTTFTVLAAAWFIAVQLFASGVGGYIAGRLRGGWARVHTDEVFLSRYCAWAPRLGGWRGHGRGASGLGRKFGRERSRPRRGRSDGSRRLGHRASGRPGGFDNGRSDGLFLRYALAQ